MRRYQNAIDTLNNGGTVAIIGRDSTHARHIMQDLCDRPDAPTTHRTIHTNVYANRARIVTSSPRALRQLEGLRVDHVISIIDKNAQIYVEHLTRMRPGNPADRTTWITP